MESDAPYRGTRVSCGRIVPLISSEVAGPLGLIHLPRLWLKGLLLAVDALAEDWGCGPGGLDRRITSAVGLDPASFVAWVVQEFPTYDACEAFVRANAASLDAESIARSNETLRTIGLPRGLGPKFRTYLRIADERFDVGIRLNNLDDWAAVHDQILRCGRSGGAIVPAISPRTTGLRGIRDLPRTWLKLLLAAADALPPADDALDATDLAVLAALHVDPDAARAFVAQQTPTYLDFEAWIERHGRCDPGAAAAVVDDERGAASEAADRALLHATLAARRRSDAVPRDGVAAFSATGWPSR